jgi:integrase/recombinase XerD
MTHAVTILPSRPLRQLGMDSLPSLFAAAGETAQRRFVEFFTAEIRNRNTRRAYALAVTQLAAWCQQHGLKLTDLTPPIIAAYVEQLGQRLAKPTVKQHLAACRMLFDYFVTGGVLPMNPASAVRGPRYSLKRGKTPVLSAEEVRALFDSIETTKIAGLRDLCLAGLMTFTFARINAALSMNVEDFYLQGRRWFVRLKEKNGKLLAIPVHHRLEDYLHAYIGAADIAGAKGTPLFRSLDRRRRLTDRRLSAREALAMVKRRVKRAGLGDACCHSFRASGITAYLRNGGTIEKAPPQYTSSSELSRLVAAG